MFFALKVFQAAWWMGLYKHVSPKRHVAWSNAPTVQCLDLGHMTRAMQKKATSQPTARSYRNKRGEKKFHGTRFLKGTQTFDLKLQVPFCLVDMSIDVLREINYIYIYIFI